MVCPKASKRKTVGRIRRVGKRRSGVGRRRRRTTIGMVGMKIRIRRMSGKYKEVRIPS